MKPLSSEIMEPHGRGEETNMYLVAVPLFSLNETLFTHEWAASWKQN